MAEQTVSIKDSADEWSATPPDFRNNIDIEQSEKDILKKEKKNEDNKSISDLSISYPSSSMSQVYWTNTKIWNILDDWIYLGHLTTRLCNRFLTILSCEYQG